MSPYLKSLLENHRKIQDEQKKIIGNAWVEPDLVFATSKGKFYDRSYLNTQLRKFLKRNNMPKITVHGIRHTMTSLMIENGINIKVISKHLGHCSISITADIYGHIFDEYEAKISNDIEKDLLD